MLTQVEIDIKLNQIIFRPRFLIQLSQVPCIYLLIYSAYCGPSFLEKYKYIKARYI